MCASPQILCKQEDSKEMQVHEDRVHHKALENVGKKKLTMG